MSGRICVSNNRPMSSKKTLRNRRNSYKRLKFNEVMKALGDKLLYDPNRDEWIVTSSPNLTALPDPSTYRAPIPKGYFKQQRTTFNNPASLAKPSAGLSGSLMNSGTMHQELVQSMRGQIFQLNQQMSQYSVVLRHRENQIRELTATVRSLHDVISQQNSELVHLRNRVYSGSKDPVSQSPIHAPGRVLPAAPVSPVSMFGASAAHNGLKYSFRSSLVATPVPRRKSRSATPNDSAPADGSEELCDEKEEAHAASASPGRPGETYHRHHERSRTPDPTRAERLTSSMIESLGIDDDLPETVQSAPVSPIGPPLVPFQAREVSPSNDGAKNASKNDKLIAEIAW